MFAAVVNRAEPILLKFIPLKPSFNEFNNEKKNEYDLQRIVSKCNSEFPVNLSGLIWVISNDEFTAAR